MQIDADVDSAHFIFYNMFSALESHETSETKLMKCFSVPGHGFLTTGLKMTYITTILSFCSITYSLLLYPFKIHPLINSRITESKVTLQEDKVKTVHDTHKGIYANIQKQI